VIPLPVDLHPLPVEITNPPPFWQSATAGVVVGALISFLGVYLTNRTADRRERDKWRRDTLLGLCTDATGAALDMESKFIDPSTRNSLTPDSEAIEPSIRRIRTVAVNLRR
jgi:hypothetical protein